MKKISLLLIILFLPSLFGFAPLQNRIQLIQPVLQSVPDNAFGYVKTVETGQWIEIGQAENDRTLQFFNRDDGIISVDTGFASSFPFFENSYSSVWASVNGLLMFADTEPDSTFFNNQTIPFPVAPNNFAAPFWDDLSLGEFNDANYHIYTQQINDPAVCIEASQCLVIEWKVTRLEEKNLLVFETVLFPNGNIRFNYSIMNGTLNQATVGIEDQDGVDGILHLYRTDGITNNTSLLFTYPPGQHLSVKTSSRYQSAFMQNNQAVFPMHLINTGDLPTNVLLTYSIAASRFSGADWSVTILDGNGLPLAPVGDRQYQLPVLAAHGQAGDQTNISVQVNATAGRQPGDFAKLAIELSPIGQPDSIFNLTLQAAIASDFTQTYADIERGIEVDFVRPTGETWRRANDYFSGSTLTFSQVTDTSYLFAWEKQKNFEDTSIIQYTQASSLIDSVIRLRSLMDNPNLTLGRFPNMSATPSGRVGVVYIQAKYNLVPNKANDPTWNVYLDILSVSGAKLRSAIPITANTLWSYRDNGPSFESAPTIVATPSNRWVLVWNKVMKNGDLKTHDLWMAVVNDQGQFVQQPVALTHSIPGAVMYDNPDLTALSGGRTLLTYTVSNNGEQAHIGYQIIGANLHPSGETLIDGGAGDPSESVEMANGNIAVGWVSPDKQSLVYTVISSAGQQVIAPQTYNSPSGLGVDNLSVTRDPVGQAIFTWGDRYNKMIYYALVDPDGGMVTPPMGFHTGSSLAASVIYLSASGEGNAPLSRAKTYHYYLPLTPLQ